MALVLFDNTYVTLVEADAFLSPRSSLWSSASTDAKERALVQATAILDGRPWLGQSVALEQPLAWPRKAFSFFDPSLNQIVEIAEGSIPRRLKTATMNQALHFLSYPNLFEGSTIQEFESISVGPISISDSDTNKQRGVSTIPITSVRRLISPLLDASCNGRTWWRAG